MQMRHPIMNCCYPDIWSTIRRMQNHRFWWHFIWWYWWSCLWHWFWLSTILLRWPWMRGFISLGFFPVLGLHRDRSAPVWCRRQQHFVQCRYWLGASLGLLLALEWFKQLIYWRQMWSDGMKQFSSTILWYLWLPFWYPYWLYLFLHGCQRRS